MFTVLARLILFIFFISSQIFFAQSKYSIQFNGGMISPLSSSKGLKGSVQLNYLLNKHVSFYIYSGYSVWDKYKAKVWTDKSNYIVNISDEHEMIPLYIGSKINFNTVPIFTTFVTLEAGYSHLSYNEYDYYKTVDSETGEMSYHQNYSSGIKVNEDVFGLGIGLGLAHPMTNYLNLIIDWKLNTHIGTHYPGFLSHRGTYLSYSAGFDFRI